MIRVDFTTGLPGSGKSTYAIEFCKKNPAWVRVNRDELRLMRGNYWIPEQEEWITSIERHAVKEAILKGYNVIVDAMNINPKYMKGWEVFIEAIRRETGLEIETDIIDFTTTN